MLTNDQKNRLFTFIASKENADFLKKEKKQGKKYRDVINAAITAIRKRR